MKALAKTCLRLAGVDPGTAYQALSARSIAAAIREQGLEGLVEHLRTIQPDISDQYTGAMDRREYERYWELKMRGLHAFQVKATLDALDHLGGDGRVIADIGDSSGNHALYLKALAPDRVARVISVNLDPVAVDKVRAKGGDAIRCRAEELSLSDIRPDLFLSFEMLEHLSDPLRFLHRLAAEGTADHVLFTVPFVRRSRFGGHDLRRPPERMPARMTAEEVHLFELSPDDWRLLSRFAGFAPVFTRVYRQYPRRSWPRVTEPLWRKLDFEGFLAVFGRRDLSVADRYADW